MAAFGAQTLDHQLDDLAPPLVVGLAHERQRRLGHRQRAHPAGAGTLVAVVAIGVVIGRGREHDGAPVADRLDRELGARDPLLDQHRSALGEQRAGVLASGLVIGQMGAHHLHALAARETGRLDRDGRLAEVLERAGRLAGGAHHLQPRDGLGRHFAQQRPREHLVPLDLSTCPRGPHHPRALGPKRVHHARLQRFVGADHRDVDLTGAGEGGHRRGVAHVSELVPSPGGGRALNDRRVLVTEERVQLAVLGHACGERALATAVADYQGAHAAQSM